MNVTKTNALIKTSLGSVYFAIILVFLYGSSPSASSQILHKKVDDYLNAWVKMGKFSGSVLIVKDGEVLLGKGYGLANHEHDIPNTPQTKFRLGSVTKQFTAAAITQ